MEMTMSPGDFWNDLRENGFLLIDAPSRKLAVFTNKAGDVVLAALDDTDECVTALDVDEIDDLVAALLRAKQEALPQAREINARYEAHVAIQNAREG